MISLTYTEVTSMVFELRLKKLINIFQVSNKQLANAVNVDPSLVSRWKNGQRYPSEKYNQIKDIAAYFTSLKGDDFQQQQLYEIISNQKLITPHFNDPVDLLTSYLSERRSPMYKQNTLSNEDLSANKALLSEKNKTNELQHTLQRPRFPLFSDTKRNYHVFNGNAGKRKAALVFLQRALDLPPTDIYLFSDEKLSWWFEDAIFQMQWNSYLRLIVLKKHRIHIVHHVQREQNQFSTYIQNYLPLHFLGQVISYYIPKYIALPIKETKFIIKNELSYVSRSTMLTPKENVAFIYEDKETVQLEESLFLGGLIYAKQLLVSYSRQDILKLLQKMIESTQLDFDTKNYHEKLNSLFLPESVFERFSKVLPQQSASVYLRLIKQLKSLQFQQFAEIEYIDIFPIDIINDIAHQHPYTHYDSTYFINEQITISQEELLETLKTMLFALIRFKNLKFALLRRNDIKSELTVNVLQREMQQIFFSANQQTQSLHIGLFSNESNLLYSYQTIIQNALVEIPTIYKEKDHVIQLFKDTIKKLEH